MAEPKYGYRLELTSTRRKTLVMTCGTLRAAYNVQHTQLEKVDGKIYAYACLILSLPIENPIKLQR